MSDSRDPPPDDAPAEGMVDLETYQRLHPEGEEQPEEPVDDRALPSVSEERLRELKRQARERIDSRLKARRKQRRLMRGGDL